MDKTKILEHTAEEIDRKLNLIAENKNLLQYPYEDILPGYLTDVGDGSILTSHKGRTQEAGNEYLLSDCLLSEGTYTISLDITNILEEPVNNSGFLLKVNIDGEEINVDGSYIRFLDKDTTILVYLVVPDDFETDLLIKPQIEKGEEKTAWVPNMDKIGTYVDRRFNSANAKFKVLTEQLANVVQIIAWEDGD